jgi:hypothetical protein
MNDYPGDSARDQRERSLAANKMVRIPLPQVNYSIVDQSALIPANAQDKQAISFGFNSGLDWEYGKDDNTGATDTDGRYIRWLRRFTFIRITLFIFL